MKKIALLCSFFLLLFSPLLAQTPPIPDSRLTDAFSTEYVDNLLASQPAIVSYWNYYLDNSYTIVNNIPEDKLSEYQDLSDLVKTKGDYVVSFEDTQLNVLLFTPVLYKDKESVYRLGDTGKLIIFYSKDVFLANFNAASDIIE